MLKSVKNKYKTLTKLTNYCIVSHLLKTQNTYNQPVNKIENFVESLENDLFIQEINSYDENDKCLISSKDTLGNVTSFEYDDNVV